MEGAGSQVAQTCAILCVSAHWLTRGTLVHTAKRPRTIHDFWGFPKELYTSEYGCPGAPELAAEVISMVKTASVEGDGDWGLDTEPGCLCCGCSRR